MFCGSAGAQFKPLVRQTEDMTTYAVAADGVHESAALCDYLDGRVAGDDVVHAVTVPAGAGGGDSVRDGEDALNATAARLGATATVETHLLDGDGTDAILSFVDRIDADELVIGVDRRPDGDVDDDARVLLSGATVPVVAVPLSGP